MIVKKGKIFMIFGPSGHGKTTLADIILNHFKDGSFVINKKLSPRPPRNEKELKGESSDAYVGLSYEEVLSPDFVQSSYPYFPFSDQWLNATSDERTKQLLETFNGTNIAPIFEALENGQNVLWLTTDPGYFFHVASSLNMRDIVPIMMWRDLDKELFASQLKQRGNTEEQIEERWNAQLKSMFGFIQFSNFYTNQYIIGAKNEIDADKMLNWFCLIAKKHDAIPSDYPIGNATDEIDFYWTKEWLDTFNRVYMKKWQEFLIENKMPFDPNHPFSVESHKYNVAIENKKRT